MAAKTKPRCYQCGTDVRSMAEHLTSAGHRARVSSVQSSGAAGSHAYSAPGPRTGREAESAYYAEREAEYLASLPPSIDELPPDELADPFDAAAVALARAQRGYRPEPCAKCGKAFSTDAGKAWHVTRNPRCEKWRTSRTRKGVAA